MRRSFLILFLALHHWVPLFARPALEQPNFVIIFLDDSGYADFSHTGNPTVNTPEVSRLAREGLNFTQFYCASPACTASRFGLLTGRNPARSGLRWVIGPDDATHIHPNEVTLAEGLKNQGYATGMFGKWHLGTPNSSNNFSLDTLPLAHGFDRFLGTNVSNDYTTGADLIESDPNSSTPISGYRTIASDILNKLDIHESLTLRYRDAAVDFIRGNADHPFFAYIAPNMPHLPVHASDPFKGRSLRGSFGDVMEEIDDLVGTVRRTLEEEDIAENTLVVVTSDNGHWIRFQDTASDSRYGEARINIGSARPFRDGKGSTWEGGVRVPGVFYWPGTIEARTVVQEPAVTLDLLPTCFALAGEPLPSGRSLDGRDIRHYFNPTLFPTQPPAFSFVYTGNSENGVYAVREGPWKLHIRLFSQTGNNYGFSASQSSPILFNVETDPSERNDVAAENPTIVNQLRDVIDAFEASVANDTVSAW